MHMVDINFELLELKSRMMDTKRLAILHDNCSSIDNIQDDINMLTELIEKIDKSENKAKV